MSLTGIVNLKANGKQHKHFDGGGLHLIVYPKGGFAEFLPERRKMMQAWADYLDELRKQGVHNG